MELAFMLLFGGSAAIAVVVEVWIIVREIGRMFSPE